MNGKPLKRDELNADKFEEAVVMEMMQQTPNFQQNVYQVQILHKVLT